MKQAFIRTITTGLLGVSLVSASLTTVAAPTVPSYGATVAGHEHYLASDARPLDPIEMEMNTGRFAVLPWVIGITSLDLAFIGVFWGIYVPEYLVPNAEDVEPDPVIE